MKLDVLVWLDYGVFWMYRRKNSEKKLELILAVWFEGRTNLERTWRNRRSCSSMVVHSQINKVSFFSWFEFGKYRVELDIGDNLE